jgi:predicted nucleic-acid-binding Zn-ribbon protein
MTRMASTADFIVKSNKIHNNFYTYKKTIYDGYESNVIITCPIHGDFIKNAGKHLEGQECPKCSKIKWNARQTKITYDIFIKQASKKHNNLYDYSLIEKDTFCPQDKQKILCPYHGKFEICSAYGHLRGRRCVECGKTYARNKHMHTTESIISKFVKIHGDTYNYSLVNYKGYAKPVQVVCKIHGIFEVKPSDHVHDETGCLKCSKRISKVERRWLDKLGIPDDKEHRQVTIRLVGTKKKFIADGYDSKNKTIYEMLGDYYHGNPRVFKPNKMNKTCGKLFKDLYEGVIFKFNLLKKNGYKIVYIWECDFNKGKKYKKWHNKSNL